MAIALLGLAAMGCGPEDEPEVEVGDQMPNLTWEGFVNEEASGLASEQPFADYSSNDLRATGKRYALVHLSESY